MRNVLGVLAVLVVIGAAPCAARGKIPVCIFDLGGFSIPAGVRVFDL